MEKVGSCGRNGRGSWVRFYGQCNDVCAPRHDNQPERRQGSNPLPTGAARSLPVGAEYIAVARVIDGPPGSVRNANGNRSRRAITHSDDHYATTMAALKKGQITGQNRRLRLKRNRPRAKVWVSLLAPRAGGTGGGGGVWVNPEAGGSAQLSCVIGAVHGRVQGIAIGKCRGFSPSWPASETVGVSTILISLRDHDAIRRSVQHGVVDGLGPVVDPHDHHVAVVIGRTETEAVDIRPTVQGAARRVRWTNVRSDGTELLHRSFSNPTVLRVSGKQGFVRGILFHERQDVGQPGAMNRPIRY